MSSRQELNVRARNAGIDPSTYPNDSKLEQRVIYEEKNNATFTGTLATSTLTSSGVNVTTLDTVTIGDRTYQFRTALTEVKATATVTSTGVTPTTGDQVSIGGITYTFRTALTSPAVPYEVLIGANADAALDNLKLAINQGSTNFPTAANNSGSGSTWSTGTIRHPDVNATTNTATTQLVVANVVGATSNTITTTANAVTLSWGSTNLTGGVNAIQDQVLIGVDAATTLDYLKDAINRGVIATTEGVGYSTGTRAHDDVTATTNTNTTQLVQAISFNAGNTIGTSKSAVTLSWTGSTLASGVAKQVAQVAADNAALSGGARV